VRRLEFDKTLGWERPDSVGRVHDGSDLGGGWEKTFGCGTNGDGLMPIPKAVEVSSSSSLSASSEWGEGGIGSNEDRAGRLISSFELLIGGSDSLSLSSYSSWLLLARLASCDE
jgi:hypothetical protein